jgi:uncharacterized repeat protein (TIGR01451 family)
MRVLGAKRSALGKSWLVAATVAAFVGAAPAVAGAQTLGSVTAPGGAMTFPCVSSLVIAQVASEQTPYTVPASGEITQWETNQTGNTAPGGEQVGLVVVRPGTGGSYQVAGTDFETLPATLPADGIVTFQVANPIQVNAGDLLGLWAPSQAGQPQCFFDSPPTLATDSVLPFGPLSGVPLPGQTLPLVTAQATAGIALDVAATFVQIADTGVTTAAGPPNALAGEPALLSSTVTNGGPDDVPVTFTDAVPAGLTIESAVAGSGLCGTAGQTVTCTISGVPHGQSVPVQIVVTPAAAGLYPNAVSITVPSDVIDPNPSNNAASAYLSVAPAPVATPAAVTLPSPPCLVPSLNRIPSSFARHVLGLLGCRVGAVRRVHSKTVAKGEVIRSTPGAGTYAAAKVVALQVSSGPAPKKAHR